METLSVELVDDLRNGRATRERKIAVCTGGAHLDPVDRAEILAVLTADPDALIAEYAEEALISQPVESFVQAVKRPTAAPLLLAYVSRELFDKPGIADALIENKNCSGDNLVAVARHLPAAGIKALLEDLDRVTESTGLAGALLNNPALTDEQKRELAELDSKYRAKIAEKELFLKEQIRKAQIEGKTEDVESLQKQLTSEMRRLQEDCEARKERLRAGFGKNLQG